MPRVSRTAGDASLIGSSVNRIADECAPLSASEELKLLASRRSHYDKRIILWKHNLRYAALLASEAWARRSEHHICTREDLEAIAVVALWNATATFEPVRKVKFISYCKWTITRDLNNHLAHSSSGFSTPRAAVRILRALKVYEDTGFIDPRYSMKRLDIARTYRSSVGSLDTPIHMEFGSDSSKHSLVPSETDVLKEVESPELKARLDALLDSLDKFDKRLPAMLRDYYGLDGRERHTYEEIAAKHGLTRQRIEQLVSRALRRLRGLAAAKKLKFQDLFTS